MNVAKELAALEKLGTNDLRVRYAAVCGEPTNARHKQWLVKRIIWRMQASEEGDLSERARRRAAELARGADVRTTIPRAKPASGNLVMTTQAPRGDGRLPLPGTLITRVYKGRTLRVTVLADGFEYEGERFGSLSAVAKAITGTHTNGYHFFRLKGGAA
jgi:hypothetical protein